MKDYSKEINAAVRELGRIAFEAAREKCPVRTGRLKNSLKLSVSTDRATGSETAFVGTNVKYAKYVEFGRMRAAPKSFLAPAIQTAKENTDMVFTIFLRGV